MIFCSLNIRKMLQHRLISLHCLWSPAFAPSYLTSYLILLCVFTPCLCLPLSPSSPFPPSDRRHVDWVRSYLSVWTEMQSFIKQHHTTGLVWSKSVSTTYIRSFYYYVCLQFKPSFSSSSSLEVHSTCLKRYFYIRAQISSYFLRPLPFLVIERLVT